MPLHQVVGTSGKGRRVPLIKTCILPNMQTQALVLQLQGGCNGLATMLLVHLRLPSLQLRILYPEHLGYLPPESLSPPVSSDYNYLLGMIILNLKMNKVVENLLLNCLVLVIIRHI